MLRSQLEAACLVTQALGTLVQRYAQRRPRQQSTGREHAALRRVQAYLADHLADDVLLEQLAQIAGFSPFHLIRVFRAATGLAPYEYLTNLRIARAKLLLAEQRSIVQVATSLGFYDQSHLHRHFKRIVGVTPGAYRKECIYPTYHTTARSQARADIGNSARSSKTGEHP